MCFKNPNFGVWFTIKSSLTLCINAETMRLQSKPQNIRDGTWAASTHGKCFIKIKLSSQCETKKRIIVRKFSRNLTNLSAKIFIFNKEESQISHICGWYAAFKVGTKQWLYVVYILDLKSTLSGYNYQFRVWFNTMKTNNNCHDR